MDINKKIINKYRRFFSFLVALCLTVGLVSLMSIPVQAGNYWEEWIELSSLNIVVGSTDTQRTLTGNYKVTENIEIAIPTAAGRSGLTIFETATIYIAPDVTLTVTGAAGSGATGAGAGIHLPDDATLILRGGGTLNATGGRAGDGATGGMGGSGTISGTSFYRSAATGGSGGGGAGAGIGGNGGFGGETATRESSVGISFSRDPAAGNTGNDGNNGYAMGTLYVLDSVTVNATGGANGTHGGGGLTASGNFSQGSFRAGGSGGGGGGGRGVFAADIGGGGAGGGSGGTSGVGGITINGSSPANANGGSGGAPNGLGGARFSAIANTSVAGNNAGLTTGGTAATATPHGDGGVGGNVGTGGTGGNVFVAHAANIGTISGGNTANGEGEAASINTQHLITYNANGGSLESVPDTQEIYSGENITAEIPTRPGHTFTNWNTAQDGKGTDYAPGAAFSANENLTLYAQWTSNFSAIANDNTGEKYSVDTENLEHDLLNVLINHIITEDDIQNQNLVTLTLNVNETDDSATGAKEITETTRGRMLQFFRITVEKQINNDTPIPLTKLPAPVQITIDLSPELSGRTGYTVYRFHDNKVQQLGMDTDAEEFFTVARGTGTGGTDQVIIHTMRFSTYAVVENIVTLDDLNNLEEFDVQARIVDLTTPIYKIDIEWGDMKFVYNLTESAGTWNPETQEYDNPIAAGWDGFKDGNNQVIVSNHSNADVLVSLDIEIGLASPVTMELFTENIENGTPATNLPLSKVPRNRADLNDVESISAYLRLKGTPNEDDIARLEGDAWHRIGIITVTITPDGDVLTPLR